MTFAAIDFNDQSLLIQAEDQTRYSEPGYARLTASGILTGEEARNVAWREPQHIYNQYWCHLNQSPLANQHRFARHHGDLAFAQLRELWKQGGAPDSLFLLVPGSFTRTQISLLMGMVEALPSRTAAVLDSALAACLDIEDNVLHVDLHLHEAVLTVCSPEGGAVRILDQEVFPGMGMAQIHNSVARHISDTLIESYRFDPMHSSETEQSIFEQIPHWLTRLGWEPEVSIKLESEKGELPCILRKQVVEEMIARRITGAHAFMDEWIGCKPLLSYHSGILAGLTKEFADARVARRSAGTRRALARGDLIEEQGDELYRLRELQRPGGDTAVDQVNGEQLATHLLCGELALSLANPVSIRLADGGPSLSSQIDKDAALTVVMRNRSLEALQRTVDITMPATCRPGESIVVGGHELKLIRVPNS